MGSPCPGARKPRSRDGTAAPTLRPLRVWSIPPLRRGLSSLAHGGSASGRGPRAGQGRYLCRCAHPRPAGSPAGSSTGRSRRCWRTPGCSAGPHTRSRLRTDRPEVTEEPTRTRAGTEVSLTWSLLLRDHRVQPPPGADGEPEVQKKARGQPGTCGEAGVGVVECWPAAWRGTTVARRPPWGTRCCSTAGHGSLGRRL